MKNLSTRIKMLILGAASIVIILVVALIAQIVAINKKQREIDKLNQQVDTLANLIAGSNPPPASVQLNAGSVVVSLEVL